MKNKKIVHEMFSLNSVSCTIYHAFGAVEQKADGFKPAVYVHMGSFCPHKRTGRTAVS
jgi:hypothetical protein